MTETMEHTALVDHLLEQQGRAENAAADSGGAPWLAELRGEALAAFRARGLPGRRDEAWKYTDTRPLAKHSFTPEAGAGDRAAPAGAAQAAAALAHITTKRLVFVNGVLHDDLSTVTSGGGTGDGTDNGLRVMSLAHALRHDPEILRPHLDRLLPPERRHGFTLFNSANLAAGADGAWLQIAEDADVTEPIELLFLSGASGSELLVQPRNLVVAGRGSRVRIIERHQALGGGCYLGNGVTEIVVAENAIVDHLKLQCEADDAYHVGGTFAEIAADATLRTTSVALGGRWVRNDVHVKLCGAGGTAHLNGLYLGDGRRHVDNYTQVEHAAPHCNSNELYKGVLADASRGVFHGRILVRPGAVKTDAYQNNRNLLLSPDAEADSKPQLEIYADDVRCSHGAVVGQLDDDALFYLRSRGVPLGEARALLVRAFIGDTLRDVDDDALRAFLDDLLRRAPALAGAADAGAPL